MLTPRSDANMPPNIEAVIALGDMEVEPQTSSSDTSTTASPVETPPQLSGDITVTFSGCECKDIGATVGEFSVRFPGDKPHSIILKEQLMFCSTMDEILDSLTQIASEMDGLRVLFDYQDDHDKPPYEWKRFDGYDELYVAIETLDHSMDRLTQLAKVRSFLASSKASTDIQEKMNISRELAGTYLRQATHLSSSVSSSAVKALAIMNNKIARCVEAMANPAMAHKAMEMEIAKAALFGETQDTLQYSTHATGRVYAAIDILQEILTTDETRPKKQAKNKTQKQDLTFKDVVIMVIFFCAAALALGSAIFCSTFQPTSNGMLASGIIPQDHWTARLQEIDQRAKTVNDTASAVSQRLDNLVDSLGPPGQDGYYDFSGFGYDMSRLIKSNEKHLKTFFDNNMGYLETIKRQVVQTHRNYQYLELRLTKQMNKLESKMEALEKKR